MSSTSIRSAEDGMEPMRCTLLPIIAAASCDTRLSDVVVHIQCSLAVPVTASLGRSKLKFLAGRTVLFSAEEKAGTTERGAMRGGNAWRSVLDGLLRAMAELERSSGTWGDLG